MAKVNNQTMADALRKAGFAEEDIVTMIAIALGESGGDSSAVCNSCLGVSEYSVGLWQINLYAHPTVTEACAKDPYCAAREAYRISNSGTNFNPWTVYKTGKYKEFLNAAKEGVTEAVQNIKDRIKLLSDDDIRKLVENLGEGGWKDLLNYVDPATRISIEALLKVPFIGDTLGGLLARIVPTSVLREGLLKLPDPVLEKGAKAAGLIEEVAETVGNVIDCATDPVGCTIQMIERLLAEYKDDVVRAGIVLSALGVGFTLIAVGTFGLVWKSPVGSVAKTAAGVASNATPTGAAAKVATRAAKAARAAQAAA